MVRRYSIFDEFLRLQREMDRLFGGFMDHDFDVPLLSYSSSKHPVVEQSTYRTPLADIWENDKEVVVTVELPGVDKKDIDINLDDDLLEIKVENKYENKSEDKKKGIYRFERSYTGFYRTFKLPAEVDKDKIDAVYNNGVLELKIPKLKAKSKSKKKISIR